LSVKTIDLSPHSLDFSSQLSSFALRSRYLK
jgi:hypothetical protein